MAAFAATTHGQYTTQFPATENPISESGQWINGGNAGANLWGNVRTSSGMAFGANEPTQFGDPTALMTGSWGPTQTVTGVVKVSSVPSSCCHEVEVRLRSSIAANNITGYEVLCPVHSSPGYGIQIVRWNGANGQYVYINTGNAHQCKNGDTLMATATGTNPTTIKVYINGSLSLTGVDHGTESGPGGAAGPVDWRRTRNWLLQQLGQQLERLRSFQFYRDRRFVIRIESGATHQPQPYGAISRITGNTCCLGGIQGFGVLCQFSSRLRPDSKRTAVGLSFNNILITEW